MILFGSVLFCSIQIRSVLFGVSFGLNSINRSQGPESEVKSKNLLCNRQVLGIYLYMYLSIMGMDTHVHSGTHAGGWEASWMAGGWMVVRYVYSISVYSILVCSILVYSILVDSILVIYPVYLYNRYDTTCNDKVVERIKRR